MFQMEQDYRRNLLKGISELEDPKMETLQFISGVDNTRVQIIPLFLTQSSEYFRIAITEHNFLENNVGEFTFEDYDGPTIINFVNFIYTGELELSDENVDTYLAIASQFQVEALQTKCIHFYETNMHMDNLVHMYHIADKYSLDNFRSVTKACILHEMHQLPEHAFNELTFEQFLSILSDTRRVSQELKIFDRVVDFTETNNPSNEQVAQLIKTIDVKNVSLDDLEGLQRFYQKYDCAHLLFDEYNKLIKQLHGKSRPDNRVEISRTIYRVFVDYELEDYTQTLFTAVKIRTYDIETKTMSRPPLAIRNIRPIDCAVVVADDLIFLIGGTVHGVCVDDVSSHSIKNETH